MKKLLELYSDNGLYLALVSLFDHVATRFRSLMLGRLLGADKLRIGAACEIRGARYMAIGSGFCSQRGLWLEAVSEYQGRRYKPRITVGRNVSCSQHVHISCVGRLEIGDNVLIGSFVYIGDHNHGRYRGECADSPDTPPAQRQLATAGALKIEDNVFIGDKVTISGGLTIGRGTIVAANSVVTRSLPPMCIAAGSPARIIKKYDQASKSWRTAELEAD